jgi:hypothetical protein
MVDSSRLFLSETAIPEDTVLSGWISLGWEVRQASTKCRINDTRFRQNE